MGKTVRTTLHVDEEVYRAAKSLAASRGESVGAVLSDLARRGLAPGEPGTTAAGFPVFQVGPDAPPLTSEMVEEADEES